MKKNNAFKTHLHTQKFTCKSYHYTHDQIFILLQSFFYLSRQKVLHLHQKLCKRAEDELWTLSIVKCAVSLFWGSGFSFKCDCGGGTADERDGDGLRIARW